MKYIYEIPASFWGLFRSVNRDIYVEALLTIQEEYQYNNYFLSREACIQILGDMCGARRYAFWQEENETEEEASLPLPGRILNWLIRSGWLRKIEDYSTMLTNIVIPDYAAVMIDAFDALVRQPMEDTEVYIQNVYATLFSFQNDKRMNLAMLQTALINTKKLNKALQDMLHNMDKFFERLLKQQSYGELLQEHLEGYVEEVVKRKYHILKTSDNFYIYKMDIKRCLKEIRQEDAWIEQIRQKQEQERQNREQQNKKKAAWEPPFSYRPREEEDVLDVLDQIERGFDDIEHRITNMDREHSKYIRATVSRLNYLLSDETKRHGMLIQLLNELSYTEEDGGRKQEQKLLQTAEHMNLTSLDILNENPLYKRRRKRKFEEDLAEAEESEPLSKDEILRLNKIRHRYTKKQIEAFIAEHMQEGILKSEELELRKDEDFEKLILAYDVSMRKNSAYEVRMEDRQVENGRYSYPAMTFVKR